MSPLLFVSFSQRFFCLVPTRTQLYWLPLHHAKRQGAESLPKSYRCEKPLKPMMAGGRIYAVYHPIKVY